MQIPSKRSFAVLGIAIFAMTCLGFAGGSRKSPKYKTDVTFSSVTKLKNGNTLPAGTYRMEVAENSQTPAVTFTQDGKVVATVDAKVVTEQKKNESTEIDSVTQNDVKVLTAIRPGGWDEELVFGSQGD